MADMLCAFMTYVLVEWCAVDSWNLCIIQDRLILANFVTHNII